MPNSGDWTAIGTGALALITTGLAWVTSHTAKADRRHDDDKRAEDRARDDRLRQEQLDQLYLCGMTDQPHDSEEEEAPVRW